MPQSTKLKANFIKYILLITLVCSYSVYSSAVIICDLTGDIVTLEKQKDAYKLTVTLKSVRFSGGHSAGERCMEMEGSTITVEVKTDKKLKKGQEVTLEKTIVYNMSPRQMHVSYELK